MRQPQIIPRGVSLPSGKTCGQCFWFRTLCYRYGREKEDDRCIQYPIAFVPYNPAIYPELRIFDNLIGSDFRCSFDSATRKKRLLEALESSNWIQKNAANLLGISPRAVNYWCRVYGIQNKQRVRRNGKLKI